MTTRTLRVGTAAAVACALLLSACGGDDSNGGDGGAGLDLVSEGTLTVCSDVPYPPFEVEDPESASGYSGFDIDLMQAIADGLELELQIADVGFDGLQSGAVLGAGQCDLGASAMTITDDRRKSLDFSDPYFDSVQSLLVPADSGITSIDQLEGVVGVQQGTTGERYATDNLPEGASPQAYPSDGELWPAMQAGSIVAILQDIGPNAVHAEEGTHEIVETYETDEQYGFAFAKGEKTALLEAVNEQLQSLRDDGTYDEIYGTYFDAES